MVAVESGGVPSDVRWSSVDSTTAVRYGCPRRVGKEAAVRITLPPQPVGVLGAAWLRCWMRTVHAYVHADRMVWPRKATQRYIYCIWHENLLVPVHLFAHSHIATLISHHVDGEYITRVVNRMGFAVVRGSSTRGGGSALKRLAELARRRHHHIALTPDGPRGPRRRLKGGVICLARLTGLPVIAVGFGYTAAWRLNSWDRFVIPRPGSTVHVCVSEPIFISRQIDDEDARRELQRAMERVQDEAERRAGMLVADFPATDRRERPPVRAAA